MQIKETRSGLLEVGTFNGEVLLGLSSDNLALSCLLSPEDAREISSFLFNAYLETQGLKVNP